MLTAHQQTRVILDALSDVCELGKITVSTDHKTWLGRPCSSDYVVIEAAHNIGFEVFEDEIIAFFFQDHCHFEDYTSELAEGEPNYLQRAIGFLRRLFTSPLQYTQTWKGQDITRSEWFFLLPDGRKESLAGPWIHKVFSKPWVRSLTSRTNWSYCKSVGAFQIVSQCQDIISVIDIGWGVQLEIRKTDDHYSYCVMKELQDKDDLGFYWTPVRHSSAIFDTPEDAIKAAKAAAKGISKK